MEPGTIAAIASALAAAGQIGGSFLGKSGGIKPQNVFDKPQRKFIQSQLGQAQQMEAGGGYSNAMQQLLQYLNPSSEAFDQFAAPYMNQFNEQIIPGLAERFASLSPMGAGLMSSGFGQALGGAGAGLVAKLAGLKSGMAQDAIGRLINQYNQLAQRGLTQTKSFYSQPESNAGPLGGAVGSLLGNVIGLGSNAFGGQGGNLGYSPQYGMTPGLEADFRSGAAYQPGY